MMKMKLNMSGLELLKKKVGKIPREAANIVANIAAGEFITMLHEAPQYSGNYVANMVIQGGDRATKPAEMIFEKPKNASEAVKRGSLAAINESLKENSGFVQQATGHIAAGTGAWMKTITIYNKLYYAKTVEEMNTLRKENAGGEHAVAKMIARLREQANRTIRYGSPEYIDLANKEIL